MVHRRQYQKLRHFDAIIIKGINAFTMQNKNQDSVMIHVISGELSSFFCISSLVLKLTKNLEAYAK